MTFFSCACSRSMRVCYIRSRSRVITYCTVSKVIPLREITAISGIASHFKRQIEVGLTNVILTAHFFLRESSPGYAEKARFVHLCLISARNFRTVENKQLTASRSSSASLCFSPGSSNVERSITLMLAHSSVSDVGLGRSHLGRAGACVTAAGILCSVKCCCRPVLVQFFGRKHYHLYPGSYTEVHPAVLRYTAFQSLRLRCEHAIPRQDS